MVNDAESMVKIDARNPFADAMKRDGIDKCRLELQALSDEL